MSIAISAKARDTAREKSLWLAKITLDAKHLHLGRLEMSGPISENIRQKLKAILDEWTKEATLQ